MEYITTCLYNLSLKVEISHTFLVITIPVFLIMTALSAITTLPTKKRKRDICLKDVSNKFTRTATTCCRVKYFGTHKYIENQKEHTNLSYMTLASSYLSYTILVSYTTQICFRNT